MPTQEIRDPTLENAMRIADIYADKQTGFSIIAVLTFTMVTVMLFALGYLFFNAPSVTYSSKHDNNVNEFRYSQK